MRRGCKVGLALGAALIAIGVVFASGESIHVRDISFLPMSAGIAVISVFSLRVIGRRLSASK